MIQSKQQQVSDDITIQIKDDDQNENQDNNDDLDGPINTVDLTSIRSSAI